MRGGHHQDSSFECDISLPVVSRVPNRFSRDPGFTLFETWDSGFESKIGASFGIEIMRRRWDAKNNPRDYRIVRNFGSDYGI